VDDRVGVYPGSFNPPTSAHVAIADAARIEHRLERIDLTVSVSALAKEDVGHPRFDHRIEVLAEAISTVSWLELRITELQLLADIAAGYDVLVVGADKWHQIHDPVWYDGDPDARDRAVAALPTVAIAPREGYWAPTDKTLPIEARLTAGVSSTTARAGKLEQMVPAARAFAERTGAWVDPDRYDRWMAAKG
jgi:nicotinic acid mononucleotide adenylyltransferase